MTATPTKPARPARVTIDARSPQDLEALHWLLGTIENEFRPVLEEAIFSTYDPEEGMYLARQFAALSQLLVDLRDADAKAVKPPAAKASASAFGLPLLMKIDPANPKIQALVHKELGSGRLVDHAVQGVGLW